MKITALYSQAIAQVFNGCAQSFAGAATVMNEIGQRLIERLDYMLIKPQFVLDLGCGPGLFTHQLSTRYPEACVVSLDLAAGMLVEAQKNRVNSLVCADMHALPFANNSFDLVFAHQVLPWSLDWPALFSELQRVIQPGGCLMFSLLGLDTFREMPGVHLQGFPEYAPVLCDMHPVGDALLAAGFLEPVVDMQQLLARYPHMDALVEGLSAQGLRAPAVSEHQDGLVPLTYEVIYGQAWRGEHKQNQQGMDIFVPIDILFNPRN